MSQLKNNGFIMHLLIYSALILPGEKYLIYALQTSLMLLQTLNPLIPHIPVHPYNHAYDSETLVIAVDYYGLEIGIFR